MNKSSDPLFSVAGRTIVITGGYGGIGRVMTLGLLERGANVAVLDLHPSEAATVAAFGDYAKSERLMVVQADVTDRGSLIAARGEVVGRLGVPHGLINNAALDAPPDSPPEENGPFETYPEESWDKVMNVNAKGVFLCCQVFGSDMSTERRGSVVNIGSIYGVLSPDQSLYQYRRERGEVFFKPVAYSASKSTLYNLTRYLAVYWGGSGVRTNILTFAGVYNHQDEEFLKAYSKKIPLRRGGECEKLHSMASAEDYLGAVIYLLSDASSYVTGSEIRIDGGFTAI